MVPLEKLNFKSNTFQKNFTVELSLEVPDAVTLFEKRAQFALSEVVGSSCQCT